MSQQAKKRLPTRSWRLRQLGKIPRGDIAAPGGPVSLFWRKTAYRSSMKTNLTNRIAAIRTLPAELHAPLRARAENPRTTADTRPFEINPVGKHRYVGRRVRRMGKRKWELFGRPDEVIAALDVIQHRPSVLPSPSPAPLENFPVVGAVPPLASPLTTPPPQPPTQFTPRLPRSRVGSLILAALVVALLVAIVIRASLTIDLTTPTTGKPAPASVTATAISAPPAAQTSAASSLTAGQTITTQPTAVFDQPSPVSATKEIQEIGARLRDLERYGMWHGQLRLFFRALEALSGHSAAPIVFADRAPFAAGQILRTEVVKAFDQLGGRRDVMPSPLRRVWEEADRSPVAAALRSELIAAKAVAFSDDQLALIPTTGAHRLAAAVRAAYRVPPTLNRWRDPASGWYFTIMDEIVVIAESGS